MPALLAFSFFFSWVAMHSVTAVPFSDDHAWAVPDGFPHFFVTPDTMMQFFSMKVCVCVCVRGGAGVNRCGSLWVSVCGRTATT